MYIGVSIILSSLEDNLDYGSVNAVIYSFLIAIKLLSLLRSFRMRAYKVLNNSKG